MINKIQNSFSIQDLEILSGVKAHTIRIWEKRYDLLNPTRLNRNIRVYDLLDLQKMLNVSLLQSFKFKISEISKFEDSELEDKVKVISNENQSNCHHVNSLLVSMFSLNELLFEEVYKEQSESMNFSDVFINTYIPLLQHIGLLWQTNRIKPVQEHFISNLIYQKIVLNIALLPKVKVKNDRINVLFLPEGEIHEIGLLFMSYHLKSMGEKMIYLGRDIPMSDLYYVDTKFEKINWICSNVIERTEEEKDEFIDYMEELLKDTNNTCQLIGKTWTGYDGSNFKSNLSFYEGFEKAVPS